MRTESAIGSSTPVVLRRGLPRSAAAPPSNKADANRSEAVMTVSQYLGYFVIYGYFFVLFVLMVLVVVILGRTEGH
jgi:hypothetical protein